MNVIGFSVTRGVKDPTEAERRCAAAQKLWSYYLTSRADRKEVQCYSSPIVLQELIHSTARILLKWYSDKKEQSPRVSALRKEVGKLVGSKRKVLDEIQKNPGRPGPRFVKAVLPIIERHLDPLLKEIQMIDDAWSTSVPGHSTITALDLVRFGSLAPADCVITITALRAQLRILVTDDYEFTRSARKLALLGLRVMTRHGRIIK